jgi:hypothetical protein
VLVVAAIIGSYEADADGDGVPDSEDGCPSLSGPAPTGCPIQQQDEGLSGIWRDESGNEFDVRHEGGGFSGTADDTVVQGVSFGTVRISGRLGPAGGQIDIMGPRGRVYQGAGSLERDPAGNVDAVFGPYRFHINH